MRTFRFLHNVAFFVSVCFACTHAGRRGVAVFRQNDKHLTVSSQNSLGPFNKVGPGRVSVNYHHPITARVIVFNRHWSSFGQIGQCLCSMASVVMIDLPHLASSRFFTSSKSGHVGTSSVGSLAETSSAFYQASVQTD